MQRGLHICALLWSISRIWYSVCTHSSTRHCRCASFMPTSWPLVMYTALLCAAVHLMQCLKCNNAKFTTAALLLRQGHCLCHMCIARMCCHVSVVCRCNNRGLRITARLWQMCLTELRFSVEEFQHCPRLSPLSLLFTISCKQGCAWP